MDFIRLYRIATGKSNDLTDLTPEEHQTLTGLLMEMRGEGNGEEVPIQDDGEEVAQGGQDESDESVEEEVEVPVERKPRTEAKPKARPPANSQRSNAPSLANMEKMSYDQINKAWDEGRIHEYFGQQKRK